MVRDLIVKSTKGIGQDNKHLKLTLGHSGLTALFWNHGHLASELEAGQPIHIIEHCKLMNGMVIKHLNLSSKILL